MSGHAWHADFPALWNLLTDKTHQPWDKIANAQNNSILWEDLCGEVHKKKAGKT